MSRISTGFTFFAATDLMMAILLGRDIQHQVHSDEQYFPETHTQQGPYAFFSLVW